MRKLGFTSLIIVILTSLLLGATPTKIDLATQVRSSAFIDSTTAVRLPTTSFPSIAAGNYVVKMAITDGASRWSNLVSYSFTADGAHSYAVQWNPPTTWWSLGPGTQFSNTFTNNANVLSWVSFNGGSFTQVVSSNDLATFIGYSWWNPYVRLSGTYPSGSTPIPSALNTLPALNLAGGGPASQITGAVLNAPQMGMINIVSPAQGLGDWLVVNGAKGYGTFFLDPEANAVPGNGAGFFFEQFSSTVGFNIGMGSLYFDSPSKGIITLSSGNNGTSYTGTLHLNLGTSGAFPTWTVNPTSGTVVTTVKGAFSALATCSSTTEGTQGAVSDSTTNTWGATITGTGSFHVLAYCDGTNWTVAGK